jgi:hypothetical protein
VSQEQSRNREHQGWNGKESQESIVEGIESVRKELMDKGINQELGLQCKRKGKEKCNATVKKKCNTMKEKKKRR